MKVNIPVKKTIYGIITIEADSLEDAFRKVQDKERIPFPDVEIFNAEEFFELCGADSAEELAEYQYNLNGTEEK